MRILEISAFYHDSAAALIDIDILVAGNCFLRKEAQDPARRLDYRDRFDPD